MLSAATFTPGPQLTLSLVSYYSSPGSPTLSLLDWDGSSWNPAGWSYNEEYIKHEPHFGRLLPIPHYSLNQDC